LKELTADNEKRLGEVRTTLETKLSAIQQDNATKLEQMRATVDEKLQSTLETRLGQSFKLVSERLEAVQRGLGEMQSLASGVGDLKRVLSNVKTRGILGEMQLGALLDQMLTPEQYASNVATVPGSDERVEFAIKLPGGERDSQVWLPIDAKFPREDYERLLDAQQQADTEGVERAANMLERRIRDEAKTIRSKYIAAPGIPPTSPSSSCPPKASTPKSSAVPACSKACNANNASPSQAPRHSPPCSTACKWASAHSPSSNAAAKCGNCSAR
jgi:DNA recombination protein RmuC